MGKKYIAAKKQVAQSLKGRRACISEDSQEKFCRRRATWINQYYKRFSFPTAMVERGAPLIENREQPITMEKSK
jgi:hypothetical protein